MGLESLFSGHALRAVEADGSVELPAFVLSALARRTQSRRIFFAPHESDPCLTGQDEGHALNLYAEEERRRRRDEERGLDPQDYHRRVRRTFGAAEAASFDSHGRIVLPEAVRRRAQLQDRALIVGTGGSFETWNPDVARASGDGELEQLAAFALEARRAGQASEERA
jgi:MraZ protein